ncbi:hypothetical protein AOLI_G00241990 [Acnodon oligacanthus]
MSGEEAAQQKLRCFPDILDIIFRLSDGSSEILVAKHLRSAESQTCRLSQICDFSIGCMHVIGGIISLYQSGISPSDGLTPIGLSVLTNQTVHVMQETERISHSSRETHIQMLHSSFHTEDRDAAPRKQVDIDSCTDEAIHNILDLHKNDVQLTESAPSEDRKISMFTS